MDITLDGIRYQLSPAESYYVVVGVEPNTALIQLADMKKLQIPEVIKGIPVKKIKAEAFKEADWLEEIRLPNTISEIGYQAFAQCQNLATFVWSGDCSLNVKMDSLVFLNCKALKTVHIFSRLTPGRKDFCKCESLTLFNCPYINGIPVDYFCGCHSLCRISFTDCQYLTAGSFSGSGVQRVAFYEKAPKLFEGVVDTLIRDSIRISCKSKNPLTDLIYRGVIVEVR